MSNNAEELKEIFDEVKYLMDSWSRGCDYDDYLYEIAEVKCNIASLYLKTGENNDPITTS